jgi:FixJ family two-component response regulator
MTSSAIVHVVDPVAGLGESLRALLATYAIQVRTYKDVETFLQAPPTAGFDNNCLLLALASIDEAGLSLVRQLHAERQGLPVIVLSDDVAEDLRRQVIDAGAIELANKSMVDAYIFTRLSTLLPAVAEHLPTTRTSTMVLPGPTPVTFRMLRPEDADIEQRFVTGLSDRSKYLRFFSGLKELPDRFLKELVNVKFPVSYAVIATIPDGSGEREIGVARYSPTDTEGIAEFAVVVADEWHGYGIASELLRGVITAATVAGVARLEGLVLQENSAMLGLASKFGFSELPEHEEGPGIVKVFKVLRQVGPD